MRARRSIVLAACILALVAAGTSSAGMFDSILGKDLDSLLGKQLGLTSDQSKGGLGAIMGMAKGKLLATDYDKLAAAVPGADKYISKAKKQGALDTPIKNMDGLYAAFEKIGIPKDKAKQFVPAAVELIGQAGGEQVKSVLSGLLG